MSSELTQDDCRELEQLAKQFCPEAVLDFASMRQEEIVALLSWLRRKAAEVQG